MDYKNNDNAALTGFIVMAGFMVLYFVVKAINLKPRETPDQKQ
jgi:hypothetical protein